MENFTAKDYWRGIVLYGVNASSYKIGLGNLLIDYADKGTQRITLDELSEDFFSLYQGRIKNGKRQNKQIGRDSIVEQQIWKAEAGETTHPRALEAIKKGPLLDQVLKYFPNLFGKPIPVNFYTVSDDKKSLSIEQPLLDLFCDKQNQYFKNQLMSRWDLLEFAFEESRKSETLGVDERKEFVIRREKRINLTPLKSTLSGYQQDRCFYCGEQLSESSHVDHVIPHTAVGHNQIWNLVVAHSTCNESKLDFLPGPHFIDNLIARNEFVIKSALPLHEELGKELGDEPQARRKKILDSYQEAKKFIGRYWEGYEKYDPSKDFFYRGWIRKLGGI